MRQVAPALFLLCSLTLSGLAAAVSNALDLEPPEITIGRSPGSIEIDGDLSDAGWLDVTMVDTWFETSPGDNVEPPVGNRAYLTYDDRFFYAGFEFQDPEPSKIRAPLGDRDDVPGYTDYGGVILDTRNDGKTGMMFLANPRGIQYDAISDDAGGGEDPSPDFFWEAKARVTDEGWVLEMRIPFSSLRYASSDPESWGIMLYRNYPRDFRYQMFSTRMPRGGSCFICNSNKVTGLTDLPTGGSLVVAPYVSGSRTASAVEGGSGLVREPAQGDIGFDVKWMPTADTVLDATLNPDFSQIESDTAQIGANERFALFFPEKRPFFLEGVELLSTPIQAVHTRTITSPRWGMRGTGTVGGAAYTALVAQDRGGGSVVLPGANSSDTADQDFRSWVAVGRVRQDFGRSFVSLLASDREVEGGGYNRVIGPDFRWRPTAQDTIAGQLLLSQSLAPNRPDLASEWDGRRLSGHGAAAWWYHSTETVHWFAQYRDFADGFRADNGFVPQVGYRRALGQIGYTFRPEGLVRRVRTFAMARHTTERDGALLEQMVSFGAFMTGRWSSMVSTRYAFDRVRAGDDLLPRHQLIGNLELSPSRTVGQIRMRAVVGQEIDFDNGRVGTGATISLGAALRPTDHLELEISHNRRWLNVESHVGGTARLFTAQIERLRATYTFTPKAFLRVIAQYVQTRRDPELYLDEVSERSGGLGASLVVGYKLNWQTVLFVGYGDNRNLTEAGALEREDRQLFAKVSYAFQR